MLCATIPDDDPGVDIQPCLHGYVWLFYRNPEEILTTSCAMDPSGRCGMALLFDTIIVNKTTDFVGTIWDIIPIHVGDLKR